MKIKINFEKNDIVKLPYNEIGQILEINDTVPWAHKFKVKILRATVNEFNSVIDLKLDQLTPVFYNPIAFSIDADGIIGKL